MSLRDKYTDEEWDAIPPFTGFHHNKVKEEIMEKAAQAIKDRCDNLDGLVFKKAKSKKSTDPSLFLLDEIGQMKIQTPCYDAPPIPLNYKDEVSPFGRVNLWGFSSMPTTIPQALDKFNNEVDKFIEEKLNSNRIVESMIEMVSRKIGLGNIPKVAILSINDCDLLSKQIEEINSIVSRISSINFSATEVMLCGCVIKVHASINAKDGEIEIY